MKGDFFFHTYFCSLHHTPYHMKGIKSFATLYFAQVQDGEAPNAAPISQSKTAQ